VACCYRLDGYASRYVISVFECETFPEARRSRPHKTSLAVGTGNITYFVSDCNSWKQDGSKVTKVINTILALMKLHATPSKMLMLLGVAVSVLIRLKNVPEEPVQRLHQDLKSGIIGLYTSTVVMSKTPIPEQGLVRPTSFLL